MAAGPAPFVLLFEELETIVQPGLEAENGLKPVRGTVALPVGAAALARTVLRAAPPTPLALEQAIEVVEDAVMPARARLPATMCLTSPDPVLRVLGAHAARAPEPPTDWLSRDAVEALFQRLAARAGGRPATQDALLVDGDSVARLIILRELLHHWALDGITLRG